MKRMSSKSSGSGLGLNLWRAHTRDWERTPPSNNLTNARFCGGSSRGCVAEWNGAVITEKNVLSGLIYPLCSCMGQFTLNRANSTLIRTGTNYLSFGWCM